MLIVGVSGGSGCGKTTLLQELQKRFPSPQLSILSQDDYYLPVDRTADNHKINFDVPEALDLDALYNDVLELKNGRSITKTEYTFNNADADPSEIVTVPSQILIVEGLFVFHHQQIKSLFDHLIFIDAEEDVRFKRRLKRDMSERGYSEESIRYKWDHQVEAGYLKYLLPYSTQVDTTIDANISIDNGLESVTALFTQELT
jgi:uridine kinase